MLEFLQFLRMMILAVAIPLATAPDYDIAAAPDVKTENTTGQDVPLAPPGPYIGKRDAYLRRANAAVAAAIPQAKAHPERPLVHFTPAANWMNDINGSYFDPTTKLYHIMYQHNPYADTWGHMHFGHATSADLVNWTHQPIAIWPSYELGEEHCYSGGGIVRSDGKPLVFYTSVGRGFREEWACLSHDGGTTWEKYPETIKHTLPDGERFSAQDAFLFRNDGHTYAISTSINGKNWKPGLYIYQADDDTLIKWTYRGKFFDKAKPCPALAQLGEKWVVLWWDTIWVGDIDWKNFKFQPESKSPLIYGAELNARGANLITTPDRTVFLTWITRRKNYDQPSRGWAGCCSLPTEVFLTGDNRVAFRPVPKLKQLRQGEPTVESASVADARKPLAISGDVLELNILLTPGTAKTCGLSVRQAADDPASGVTLTYDSEKHELRITGTGEKDTSIPDVNPVADGKLTLHLFLDRPILELFINDGEKYAVNYLHHPAQNQAISAFAHGGQAQLDVTAWRLAPSLSQRP